MKIKAKPLKLNKGASGVAMDKLSDNFKRFMRPYWAKERNPNDNRKWVARKDDKPHPLLRETGKMLSTVMFKSNKDKLIADMVEYGIFHQLGTDDMPAREWLGMTKEALEFYVDTFLEELIPE